MITADNKQMRIGRFKHPEKKPDWLPPRMFQMLQCLTPGPLGYGLTQEQAAIVMKVSTRTMRRLKKQFRDRFPEPYDRFMCMHRTMVRHGQKMGKKHTLSLEGLMTAMSQGFEETGDINSVLYDLLRSEEDSLGHEIESDVPYLEDTDEDI